MTWSRSKEEPHVETVYILELRPEWKRKETRLLSDTGLDSQLKLELDKDQDEDFCDSFGFHRPGGRSRLC